MATTVYDKLLMGHKTLNVTQIGRGYDGKNHYSHDSYEIDIAGEDSGRDVYRNKDIATCWIVAGKFGTKSTGNTCFFQPCDAKGNRKKVYTKKGVMYVTLALTHSNNNYTVGQIFGHDQFMYQEGTAGYATGNHIHLELATGLRTTKNKKSGAWNIDGIVPVNQYMYLLKGYTSIKNSGGLSWTWTDSPQITIKSGGSTSSNSSIYPKKIDGQVKSLANGKTYTAKVNLNCRIGTKVLVCIPKGTKIHYYGNWAKTSDGAYWCWVQVTVNGKSYTGFVKASSDYLQGYNA